MKKNYQTTTAARPRTGRTTPKKAKTDPSRAVTRGGDRAARHRHRGHRRAGRRARGGPVGLRRRHRAQGARRGARVRGHRPGRREGAATTPSAAAVRHGSDDGLVTLGGRQVPITPSPGAQRRPLGRGGAPDLPAASSTELLGREAMEKMLAKLSTRRYRIGLEPMGEAIERPRPARRPSRRCRVASSPPPSPHWPS